MTITYRGYTLARYGVTADNHHISIYSGAQKIDEAASLDAAKLVVDSWLEAK